MITPVILCGGNGTRLWPRSRKAMPKPFLPLVGERTLFEATIDRCADRTMFAPPMIVTGQIHLDHVMAQLGGVEGARIIVEPSARNTAPAIALAALSLPADAIMLVCPSDHHIGNTAAFADAVGHAATLATGGWLVALGIAAQSPETGFGYIQRGEAIGDDGFRAARFVEKPDADRAAAFVASGDYSWNGGIFAFRAGTYLTELGRFRPDILEQSTAAMAAMRTDDATIYPGASAFDAISGESIDYAVMEHTHFAAMVPVAMDWSDIGNWQALHAALDQDPAGNIQRGNVELHDCRNVMVDSDGPHVSVIGLDNIAIVVDGNDVMVTTLAQAQHVGKLSRATNQ